MKKATLYTIAEALTVFDSVKYAHEIAEINAELSRGQARKDATATAYAEMWEQVRQALSDATDAVTAQEIADETGLSRSKIVYGLTNYWTDEVVKDTSGKSTTYALKG